jgi:nitrite reductase/ring-hydroxylating ferredoxin subunit
VNDKPENRVDKIVSDLLHGRRLKLRAGDAEEKAAITTAARLAGARHGPQRMTPVFRKRLERALEQAPQGSSMTRRMALVAGLGLAAGAAGGGWLGRSLSPQPAHSTGGGPINPVNGKWFDVAAFADLVEGHGKHVTAGAVGAFVFRKGDSVYAVSSICSHLPCELWWDGHGGVLACPCHPVNFTAQGKVAGDKYDLPALNTVHARITDAGRVEVLGAE